VRRPQGAPLRAEIGVDDVRLRVDLYNGARIRLYGGDNADRLRGIYLDGVIFDEYADMSPRVWLDVVRPALSDRRGWAVFIGTPTDRNSFYDIFDHASATRIGSRRCSKPLRPHSCQRRWH
jgi:hypothetical protein